jgi:hypothetical protein
MKTYLAIEHGEMFHFEAKDKQEAKETAPIWGAELLGEVPKKYETASYKVMLKHLI